MPADAELRARIEEHWRASERGDIAAEHAIYADDAILDYPQSGERFRGRATIAGASAAGTRPSGTSRSGGSAAAATLWVSECVITYDGAPTHSVSIMELADGQVVHETQYFADPFPPAPAAPRSRRRSRSSCPGRYRS